VSGAIGSGCPGPGRYADGNQERHRPVRERIRACRPSKGAPMDASVEARPERPTTIGRKARPWGSRPGSPDPSADKDRHPCRSPGSPPRTHWAIQEKVRDAQAGLGDQLPEGMPPPKLEPVLAPPHRLPDHVLRRSQGMPKVARALEDGGSDAVELRGPWHAIVWCPPREASRAPRLARDKLREGHTTPSRSSSTCWVAAGRITRYPRSSSHLVRSVSYSA